MQFICASCDDAVDCRYAMLPASCSCTLMPSCVLVARMPIFVCMVVHVLCNERTISVVQVCTRGERGRLLPRS